MGLKENFSQAVKDLTGSAKEDEKKKNTQVAGLKKALGDDSDYRQPDADSQRFIEGASQPYYRNTPPQSAQSENAGSEQGYRADTRRSDINEGIGGENAGYGNQSRSYNNLRENAGYDTQGSGYNDPRENTGYDAQGRGYGSDRDVYGESRGYARTANQQQDNGGRYGADRQYGSQQSDINRGQADRFYGANNDSRGYGSQYRQDSRTYAPDGSEKNDTYPVSGKNQQPDEASDNELTVISKNTVIDGSVRSFANMSIDGDIKGDVETTKDIELNGRIVGNMICNNANMIVSQVQGNVQLKGNVSIARDTLLIGDLSSGFASINGKVKGNVEISGKAEFKADAVIFGDISASTITVDDGAIIQGYVSTTFLNKDESANIFPDAISIGE